MRASLPLAIGALAALALQLVLAPALSILGAMPDFVLVFVGVAAMLRPSDSVVTVGFGAGMVYDLVTGGTPGVMAALLAAAAFLASRASERLGNDTLSVALLITMMSSLLVEACYALFYVATADVSVVDALTMRALPCALYDCAVCLIALPLLGAFLSRTGPSHKAPDSSTIRLR